MNKEERYELKKLLTNGAFGQVFSCCDNCDNGKMYK